MTAAEIACRSQQETVKTVDRLLSARRKTRSSGLAVIDSLVRKQEFESVRELYRQGKDSRAAGELFDYFRQHLPSRFFEPASADDMAEVFKEHCPYHIEQVLKSAEAVCRYNFEILGYGELSYGSPPNWHLDPISGIQAPMLHWSRIDALDCSQVGDNKVIWELNRHQWMLDLAQAYRFTGDERYARCYAELTRDWLKHNPVGFGINWHSSLEVAMRLISWSWALLFLRNSRVMTPSLFAVLLEAIRQHARHIENYLSYYFSPNTHLTGEALGLCYAGLLFPELKEARRWQALGEGILKQEAIHQVYTDGVYFEQSTRYQYYTIEIYLQFILLCGVNGNAVPSGLTDRVQRMLEYLLAVRQPDGAMPQIGDADGGCLLPLVRRGPADCRGLFALGALLFRRGDFAWAAGGKIAPEALWLAGSSSLQTWLSLRPTVPAANSAIFKQGGLAVLRNGWQSDSHQLIFDFGPLGCRHSSGHGHADLLSIQCSAFGEAYVVDAGTGNYRGDSNWRDYFRSADAHSTVIIDGANQADPDGPFSWRGKKPAAWLERCETGDNWQLIQAAREDLASLKDPVTHRRRVLFADAGWWLVIDDLIAQREHEVAVRFQFNSIEVQKEDDQWVRALGKKGSALSLKCFCASEIDIDIASGSLHPLKGWVSPNYGQQHPAPALTFTVNDQLPLRLMTLFLPQRQVLATTPPVTMSISEGITELQLCLAAVKQTVCISDCEVSLEEAA